MLLPDPRVFVAWSETVEATKDLVAQGLLDGSFTCQDYVRLVAQSFPNTYMVVMQVMGGPAGNMAETAAEIPSRLLSNFGRSSRYYIGGGLVFNSEEWETVFPPGWVYVVFGVLFLAKDDLQIVGCLEHFEGLYITLKEFVPSGFEMSDQALGGSNPLSLAEMGFTPQRFGLAANSELEEFQTLLAGAIRLEGEGRVLYNFRPTEAVVESYFEWISADTLEMALSTNFPPTYELSGDFRSDWFVFDSDWKLKGIVEFSISGATVWSRL